MSPGGSFCRKRVTSAGVLCHYMVETTGILENPFVSAQITHSASCLHTINSQQMIIAACVMVMVVLYAFILYFLKLKKQNQKTPKEEKCQRLFSMNNKIIHIVLFFIGTLPDR